MERYPRTSALLNRCTTHDNHVRKMPELHAPELHRPNSVGYDSRMLTWVFRWCGTPALLTSPLLAASSVPPKELPLRQPAVAKKVSFRCQLHIRLADPMYVLVHTMPHSAPRLHFLIYSTGRKLTVTAETVQLCRANRQRRCTQLSKSARRTLHCLCRRPTPITALRKQASSASQLSTTHWQFPFS